jgi:CheY-like chemotaxis protein
MDRNLTILLAEDNPGDAYLIAEALSLAKLSFRLDRASDGGQALHALQEIEKTKSQVSLIVLDLNLPKISGHELLEMIRKSRYLKDTPVIVITSSDSPQDRAKTDALGVNYYFRKPSELDEFLTFGDIVRQVCQTEAETAK